MTAINLFSLSLATFTAVTKKIIFYSNNKLNSICFLDFKNFMVLFCCTAASQRTRLTNKQNAVHKNVFNVKKIILYNLHNLYTYIVTMFFK